jgi:AcrR family transcriptional regulator
MPRARSEEAHRKVIEAAVRLFAKEGIDGTSMDAVASASGVSKATIYKHWPDKDKLALEVLTWLYQLDDQPPIVEYKNLRGDLIAALRYRPVEHHSKERERIMPHLIAYSARNPVFGKEWRSRVLRRQCEFLERTLKSAVERGDLRPEVTLEVALALLFGPMLYRQIFVAQSRTEPAPQGFVEEIVDAFLLAFANRPQARTPARPIPITRAL